MRFPVDSTYYYTKLVCGLQTTVPGQLDICSATALAVKATPLGASPSSSHSCLNSFSIVVEAFYNLLHLRLGALAE